MGIYEKVCTSFGTGYRIKYYIFEKTYYGYTKRQAFQLFRNEYGLKGKHIDFIDISYDFTKDITVEQ